MQDNMDNLFKNALSELDTIPPQASESSKEKIWSEIESKINNKPRWGNSLTTWILFAGLGLLLVLSIVLTNTRTKKKSHTQEIKREVKAPPEISIDETISEKKEIGSENELPLLMNDTTAGPAIGELPKEFIATDSAEPVVHVNIPDTDFGQLAGRATIVEQGKRRKGKYYYNHWPNVESINQYFDRERSFFAETSEDETADFYSFSHPDSMRNGILIYYYKTGEVYEKDLYKAGLVVSKVKYYKDGTKMMYETRKPAGLYPSSHNLPFGKMINQAGEMKYIPDTYTEIAYFKDAAGVKVIKDGTGKYVETYSNGKKMIEGEYKDGIPVGEWTGYYDNGNKMFDGHYTSYGNWQIHNIYNLKGEALLSRGWGTCVVYYPNGKKQLEARYSNGFLIGEVRSYYSNGQLKSTSEYEEGKLKGVYTSYYSNGKVYTSGEMRLHKKIGEWKFFDCNGTLMNTLNYTY